MYKAYRARSRGGYKGGKEGRRRSARWMDGPRPGRERGGDGRESEKNDIIFLNGRRIRVYTCFNWSSAAWRMGCSWCMVPWRAWTRCARSTIGTWKRENQREARSNK